MHDLSISQGGVFADSDVAADATVPSGADLDAVAQ